MFALRQAGVRHFRHRTNNIPELPVHYTYIEYIKVNVVISEVKNTGFFLNNSIQMKRCWLFSMYLVVKRGRNSFISLKKHSLDACVHL